MIGPKAYTNKNNVLLLFLQDFVGRIAVRKIL